MTRPHKHATSSVHFFSVQSGRLLAGLILHPRLGKWMLPGGHVEPHENAAEAALREVLEETGLTAILFQPGLPRPPGQSGMPPPYTIAEQHVPADTHFIAPHIHIDHIYVALADPDHKGNGPGLPFEWYPLEKLRELDMFDATRRTARHLFDQLSRADLP